MAGHHFFIQHNQMNVVSTTLLICMSLGTGKTLIGVKIAYRFVQRNAGSGKQVLFCGPSNYSVDVVAGNC